MASVLGKRLKEARVRLGWSQEQLGLKAGLDITVASTRINQYERSVHAPRMSVAGQLANALGVPVAYLYATDDQLAAWILAFAKTPASTRRSILEKADIDPRHL